MNSVLYNHTVRGVFIALLLLTIIFTAPHFFTLVGRSDAATSSPHSNTVHADPFAELDLSATSVYVYDIRKQEVLYEKNADTPLPLASVTKVMTGLLVSEIVPRNSVVSISRSALTPEGDSGFAVGEEWEVDQLRNFTLMTSSNDGAHALASVGAAFSSGSNEVSQFVDRMNTRAKQLGLQQTYYVNPSGLDESKGIPGGYGSARDMAHLFSYIFEHKPQVLAATAAEQKTFTSTDKIYTGENTNRYVEYLPGVIASKTGFTDLAGGNLVIAFDAGLNRPIVISVLGSGRETRFSDVEKLVHASIAAIQQ